MDMNSYLSGTLLVIFHSILLSSAAVEPFDLLYDNAIDAFHSGDYENVVRYMEGALSSFAKLRHTKVRCRLKCKDKHRFDADPFSDLKFFDVILRRASCLNDCMENKLGPQSMHKVSEDVIQDFNRRIPYNYLQMAYLKVNERSLKEIRFYTFIMGLGQRQQVRSFSPSRLCVIEENKCLKCKIAHRGIWVFYVAYR